MKKLRRIVDLAKAAKRQGWASHYQRYVIRPRILQTKPCHCPADAGIEVFMLLYQRDWLNAFWTLKSFAFFAKKPFRLVLHIDPEPGHALTPKQIDAFVSHFPGAVFVDPRELKARMNDSFRPIAPNIASLWDRSKVAASRRAIDAFLMTQSALYLDLDPDVIFFAPPTEIVANAQATDPPWFITCNVLRYEVVTAGITCLNTEALRRKYGIEFPSNFGAGMSLINKRQYDWSLLDRVFGDSDVIRLNTWVDWFLLDLVYLGITAATKGFQPLPTDRYVIEPVGSLKNVVARHYYSDTRHLLYREGVQTLNSEAFLERFDSERIAIT